MMTLVLDPKEVRMLRKMLSNHEIECREMLGWLDQEKEGKADLDLIKSIRGKMRRQ
jgi:hypothetical protein